MSCHSDKPKDVSAIIESLKNSSFFYTLLTIYEPFTNLIRALRLSVTTESEEEMDCSS